MKNCISVNIKYLCNKNYLTQTEFGNLFGLKQSLVNAYINEKAIPKVETMMDICQHFKVDLGDFISRPLAHIALEMEKKVCVEPNALTPEDVQRITYIILENEGMFAENKTFCLFMERATSRRVNEELRRLLSNGA